MRAPSSTRRLRSRPPRHRPITELAHAIDGATAEEPSHLAIYVAEAAGPADEVEVGLRPFPTDIHPFTELSGLVAPPEWSMFGLRVHGTGHHLAVEGRRERTVTTFLLARTGEEVTLLRMGGAVTEVPETAQGTLPDLCRRVLGRPTAPAPPSTAVLHTLSWLDSVLERWGEPRERRRLRSSFAAVAACHPAVVTGTAPTTLDALVALAREHTAAWPWSRLRGAPDALPLPGGGLPPAIAGWMDDGFFARWATGAFPDPLSLVTDVTALLGAEVGPLVQRAVLELLTPEPT